MQRLILELESDVVTLRRRLRQSEEEMAKKIKVQGICDGDLFGPSLLLMLRDSLRGRRPTLWQQASTIKGGG